MFRDESPVGKNSQEEIRLQEKGDDLDDLASSITAYYNNIPEMNNYVSQWMEDEPFDEEPTLQSEDGEGVEVAYRAGVFVGSRKVTSEDIPPLLPPIQEDPEVASQTKSNVDVKIDEEPTLQSEDGEGVEVAYGAGVFVGSRKVTSEDLPPLLPPIQEDPEVASQTNSNVDVNIPQVAFSGDSSELDAVVSMVRNQHDDSPRKRRRIAALALFCCLLLVTTGAITSIALASTSRSGSPNSGLDPEDTSTISPSDSPPSVSPSIRPSVTVQPSSTSQPSGTTSMSPSSAPSTPIPVADPTPSPTGAPVPDPTPRPTEAPVPDPTRRPSPSRAPVVPDPTPRPTGAPVSDPTRRPSPSRAPVADLTPSPTGAPVPTHTRRPTGAPVPDHPTRRPSPSTRAPVDPTRSPSPSRAPVDQTQMPTCINKISVDKVCYEEQDDIIIVDFEVCDPQEDDWVGLYLDGSGTGSGAQYLDDDYITWAWTCGTQTCGSWPSSNTFGFEDLGVARFRAFLVHDNPNTNGDNNGAAPYQIQAMSDSFVITRGTCA